MRGEERRERVRVDHTWALHLSRLCFFLSICRWCNDPSISTRQRVRLFNRCSSQQSNAVGEHKNIHWYWCERILFNPFFLNTPHQLHLRKHRRQEKESQCALVDRWHVTLKVHSHSIHWLDEPSLGREVTCTLGSLASACLVCHRPAKRHVITTDHRAMRNKWSCAHIPRASINLLKSEHKTLDHQRHWKRLAPDDEMFAFSAVSISFQMTEWVSDFFTIPVQPAHVNCHHFSRTVRKVIKNWHKIETIASAAAAPENG